MVSSYLTAAKSGLLAQRISQSQQLLKNCNLCPRNCNVDRLAGESGLCNTGAVAKVSSYGAHFGEEAVLVGKRGSGTIFFCGCSLLCVFCQNYDISHAKNSSCLPMDELQLARLMVSLQEQGCNNINLVTPGHLVPQILGALPHAVKNGLKVPIVYNSSGYDKVSTLKLLDGIIDIYMPDFKFWSAHSAKRYANAKNYPETAQKALKEMHRQVGDLKINKKGEAKQGLIVRHLLMPGGAEETDAILKFLAKEISVNCFVNIMDQYRVAGTARQFPELNAVIYAEEYQQAIQKAKKYGLTRLNNS
ncbi:MAG: radical SAM protein [Desulforegulaceae bacterium]|nr:radical SAM protein [Desulforegulaceae bacterium]